MSGSLVHHGEPPHDLRVYQRDTTYVPQINLADTRMYCHAQQEGEEYYHRIALGEVYLNRDDENFCLNCGFRRGLISLERPTLEHAAFKTI